MFLIHSCDNWYDFPCRDCPIFDHCFCIEFSNSFLSQKLKRAIENNNLGEFVKYLSSDSVKIANAIDGAKIEKIEKLLKLILEKGWGFSFSEVNTGTNSIKILEDLNGLSISNYKTK